jgi:hypothetical protein
MLLKWLEIAMLSQNDPVWFARCKREFERGERQL